MDTVRRSSSGLKSKQEMAASIVKEASASSV
jgi:hypothetical protein